MSLNPEQFKARLPDEHIRDLFDSNNNLRMDDLRDHPIAQRMVGRALDAVQNAHKRGLAAQAEDYYPTLREHAVSVGTRFNQARERRGRKLYFPDQPEQAGALIGGQLSAATKEETRLALTEKAAKTGSIPRHIAQPRIMNAIKQGIPAIDAAPPMKIRDFTGSTLHPHQWPGIVADRVAHDVLSGHRWGEQSRGMSDQKSAADVRRYRFHQGAMELARQALDTSMPAPTFQSLLWHGGRR